MMMQPPASRVRRPSPGPFVAGLALLTGWLALPPSVGVAQEPPASEVLAREPVSVSFDLSVAGKPAGSHTLTVRFVPPKDDQSDEARIIESFEDIGGEAVPEALQRRTRATARTSGSTLSFTAVTETGPVGSGRVTEVNGRRTSDGEWTLVVTRGGATEVRELRRSQVDVCTLDIFDPVLYSRWTGRDLTRMVDITTGDILEGKAEDMGEVAIDINNATQPVLRIGMNIASHDWQWDRTLEGIVIRYDGRLGDAPLAARIQELPESRVWGQIETSTRFDNGVIVEKGEL